MEHFKQKFHEFGYRGQYIYSLEAFLEFLQEIRVKNNVL